MAILDKFYGENDSDIVKSVSKEIEMLFENRYDNYVAYDFKTNKLVHIYEFFKIDPFEIEFAQKLKQAIEVIDLRTQDISVEVKKINAKPIIYVNGNIISKDALIQMPQLAFNY